MFHVHRGHVYLLAIILYAIYLPPRCFYDATIIYLPPRCRALVSAISPCVEDARAMRA